MGPHGHREILILLSTWSSLVPIMLKEFNCGTSVCSCLHYNVVRIHCGYACMHNMPVHLQTHFCNDGKQTPLLFGLPLLQGPWLFHCWLCGLILATMSGRHDKPISQTKGLSPGESWVFGTKPEAHSVAQCPGIPITWTAWVHVLHSWTLQEVAWWAFFSISSSSPLSSCFLPPFLPNFSS